MELSSSPMLQTPAPKENHYILNWFELSVSKKRSIVLATILVGNMVRKYLGKNPKATKENIETILNIDERTR